MSKIIKSDGKDPEGLWVASACRHFEDFINDFEESNPGFLGSCERKYEDGDYFNDYGGWYMYTFTNPKLWGILKVALYNALEDRNKKRKIPESKMSTIVGIHVSVESSSQKDEDGTPFGIPVNEFFNMNPYGYSDRLDGITEENFCDTYVRPFMNLYLETTDLKCDHKAFFDDVVRKADKKDFYNSAPLELTLSNACMDCISAMVVYHADIYGFKPENNEKANAKTLTSGRTMKFNDGLSVMIGGMDYAFGFGYLWSRIAMKLRVMVKGRPVDGTDDLQVSGSGDIDATLPYFYKNGDNELRKVFKKARVLVDTGFPDEDDEPDEKVMF